MRRHKLILLGLVVCGLALFTGFDSQHPPLASAQGETGTIAYVVPNDTTGDEIWLVEPDGTNKRKIYSVNKADPNHIQSISDLAWRPDAGTLAFASNHEEACSWYSSDVYAILANGSGYRRVTNAPDCATLASYPKSQTAKVTVGVTGSAFHYYQVYVQGSPELLAAQGGQTVEFTNVVDLGDIDQPAVAIDGDYRWMGDGVKVQAGQTADGGVVDASSIVYADYGIYKLTWNGDGSRIGYALNCRKLYGIAANPLLGSIGDELLPNVNSVYPCVMAWGPTPSTANQIAYYTQNGARGIYTATVGISNPGNIVVDVPDDFDKVSDIEYLPDGSGFLYTLTGFFRSKSNLFLYSFASKTSVALTNFPEDMYARDFTISPDGKKVVMDVTYQMYSENDPADLYILDLASKDLKPFVTGAAHPTWSPHAIQVPPPDPSPDPSPNPNTLTNKLYVPFLRR